MKIGFDAKRYFNNSTGLGNYARWLVDGLAQRNAYEYHLYQPNEISQTVNLPVHSPIGISKASPSLWRSRFVCSRLEADGIDIFHGLSNEIPFGIHKTNIKAVVTIHDLINKRYPKNYRSIDKIIYNRKLHYAQKHATKIITPSEQTKADLIHYFGTDKNKVDVIPLSVQPRKHAEHTNQVEGPYMLCVSGFSKRKNIPTLIKSYLGLYTNVKLVLAGQKGDTYKEVKALAKHNPNIIIKTNVSNAELDSLYQHSLFCVYPSLFEGFGIPILEAFSYGKTVATSNLSSMPEVGGYAALYFNPLDVDEITKTLRLMLQQDNRAGLESLIISRLSHFDSEKLLARYEALYQSL
jgi:glycosyltransferase involved in cell wall biosynthesis